MKEQWRVAQAKQPPLRGLLDRMSVSSGRQYSCCLCGEFPPRRPDDLGRVFVPRRMSGLQALQSWHLPPAIYTQAQYISDTADPIFGPDL